MQQEHKTVFISYRRDAAAFIARSIFLELREHDYDVFMDVESIDSGQFEQIIFNQIEARAHFLIVLTPGTVERYKNANDMMRREIEFALEKRRNIVPLLVNNFSFGDAQPYLTGKLATLPSYNGVAVPHDYFEAAMERLRSRFLKQPVAGAIKAAPAGDHTVVQRKIKQASVQPAPTQKELSAEDYFAKALALNDNSEQEITYYTEAIRLNPQYANAYYNRGVARKAKGDLDSAIADYTEAIRLNPQHSNAYYGRGLARQAKSDNDGAITDYNEAIRLDPQFANAYNNRGAARYAQDDNDGAITDYNEAIRLNPQYAPSHNNRGLARQAKGDLDGAITDYNEAIRLNPQYARAYKNRGITRKTKGDLKNAITDYQKYLDLGGGKENRDQAEVEQIIRDLEAKLKSKKP